MPSAQVLESKKKIVADLTDKLQNAVACVIVKYEGITVEDDTALRAELRKAGVEYSVVKNTLTKRACENTGYGELANVLEGMTAVATSANDPVAAAKITKKFADKVESFEVKAGPEKGGRVSFVYELGFYLGGDGKIVIGDNEYDVHFGDIRFVPPGTFLNSVPEYRCYTVTFDFGESNTIYKNQIIDSIPEYFQTTGELLKQFEELVKSVASTEAVEKIRQGAKLMQLISDIFEMFHLEKKYCKAVRACISYMEENYNDAITLKQLGEISGYSDIHTMRLFRRDTGQTPHEWLTNITHTFPLPRK